MSRAVSPLTGFDRFLATPVVAAVGAERAGPLWRTSAVRRYAAGQVVRTQGQSAEHLLVLLSGRVSATCVTSGGQAFGLGDVTGPRALDKVAVIDGGGHTATLTAATRSVVAAVPARAFLRVVDELPTARSHVLGALADLARTQQARLMATATTPGRVRVARWLAEQWAGRDDGAGGRIPLPGSQGRLGELLGITRVTVNRALADLERSGVVRRVPGAVDVLDPSRLPPWP